MFWFWVTKSEVIELFGNLGLEKLKSLIANGAILDHGDIVHASKKDFSMDLSIMKDHLPELVKFYQPERLEEGNNLFYTLSESLNEDGIKKVNPTKLIKYGKIITGSIKSE